MNNIEEAERIIGYTFKDKELLTRALTHSSYAHEQNVLSYQNLEFLGDSLLNFIVAEQLIKLFPDALEGELTRYRAALVAKDPLADVIENSDISKFILTNKKSILSRKTLSDVFESIAAAIYYDGGMENTIMFINKFLGIRMKESGNDTDYKSRLLEKATQGGFKLEFRLKEHSGSDHEPIFKYDAVIDGKVMGTGEDKSKRAAQQEAARIALMRL